MLISYMYHIWFKVCRPIKRKYKLSVNCTLVLNGAYILQKITNKPFTLRQLRTFASYYNHYKIFGYIMVLVHSGCIIEVSGKTTLQYYTLSEKGITVIKELEESYNRELSLFCSKYDINL